MVLALDKVNPIGGTLVHHSNAIVTFRNRGELLHALRNKGVYVNRERRLVITDLEAFRCVALPLLAANVADFGETSASKSVQALAAWMITEAAQQLGAKLASPQAVYVAIAEGRITRTVSFPAVNIRGNSLDTARALFRAAIDNKVGALIIEIARSEIGYTNQSPREFAAVIQAAAMMEGFTGPIFLQGDHIQLKAKPVKKGGTEAEAEIAAHAALIRQLVMNGIGSIDLDMSTLEDRRSDESELTFAQQQSLNALWTAKKVAEVRALERELGVPWETMLGGETGEVGDMNTRREDIDAYLAGIREQLTVLGVDDAAGIRKLAVNDGTSHGGTPLPDGTVAQVDIDFSVLEMATEAGRSHGLAGSVQHGASTLPANAFSLFPHHRAVEVHLATDFQNTLFDDGINVVPGQQAVFEALMADRFGGEWKRGKQTFAQFVYKVRKQTLGPKKFEIWTMPREVRAAVAGVLYDKFSFLFQQLGVVDTVSLVAEHTPLVDFHRPYPTHDGYDRRATVDLGASRGGSSGGLSD